MSLSKNHISLSVDYREMGYYQSSKYPAKIIAANDAKFAKLFLSKKTIGALCVIRG